MKKAFVVATVAVWALGLIIGLGFGVAGELTGTNKFPGKIHQLRTERNSLIETIAVERYEHDGRVDQYLASIGLLEFQNEMMVEYLRLEVEHLRLDAPIVTSVGPLPHEE